MAQDYTSQITSMLGGGGASDGSFWNFSKQDAEDFSPVFEGTVVKISFSQERKWDSVQRKFTAPAFWDDGNPKIMFRLHMKDASGKTWLHEVKPKSHALLEDWLPACPGNNLSGLLGMMVRIEAEQEFVTPTGQKIPFGAANRRHFKVTVMGQGAYPSEGVDNDSYAKLMERRGNGGQQAPAPAGYVPQGVYPQQPPRAGYAPQQYQQQAQYQQPQQYQQQPMNAAMAAAYNAAQAAGFTADQQPVASAPQPVTEQPPVDVYDNEIPF